MKRFLNAILCVSFLFTAALAVHAQIIANKKLSNSDLEAAQAETASAGGKDAQLIYATRLDAVEKGVFDSLAVIYGKGQETYAMVVRGGKRHMLKADPTGQAVKAGDQFQRMGIKYEAGKAPLLRLFAVAAGGLRNADFRFNGVEFVTEAP
jgi:hypothetical protein